MRIPISVYETESKNREIVLIVYGGSTTMNFSQKKCWRMKKYFAEAGFTAASFDFRGNIPGTDFRNTGLRTRIQDARAVFLKLKDAYPDHAFTVLGISMGGYIATFLLGNPATKHTVLIAPAAYHRDAVKRHINFGASFSELIRKSQSWASSDGFENIAQCAGSLLVMRFTEDTIVPREIPARYYHAFRSINKMFVDIPGYGHEGNWDGQKLKDIMGIVIPWLTKRP